MGCQRHDAARDERVDVDDLRHGLYHADPHPGNFLIPDPEHLVLLDYGDVGYLAGPRRNDVIRLLTAVIGRDVSDLTDVIIVVCNAPASTDVKDLEMAIDKWMAQYLPEDTASNDIELSAAMNACMQLLHEKELVFPSDLAMLVRVMGRLEGFGIQLGSTVTMEEYLTPYLRRHVMRESSPKKMLERLVRSTTSWTRMARELPRDIEILVQQLRKGETRLEINLRDPDELTDKLIDGSWRRRRCSRPPSCWRIGRDRRSRGSLSPVSPRPGCPW